MSERRAYEAIPSLARSWRRSGSDVIRRRAPTRPRRLAAHQGKNRLLVAAIDLNVSLTAGRKNHKRERRRDRPAELVSGMPLDQLSRIDPNWIPMLTFMSAGDYISLPKITAISIE
jgi:hypothetical protein